MEDQQPAATEETVPTPMEEPVAVEAAPPATDPTAETVIPPIEHAHGQERIILPTPEEFAHDEKNRLGRANGNVWQRKPGIEGMHDGQIMVRLKKKRVVVLDYSLTSNSSDGETLHDGAVIPDGAGKQKCISPECTKVGVPILLFDSEPHEPASLYMRSGLCFTCQRLLNEKRRTQRKRKSDIDASGTPTVDGTTTPKPKKVKYQGQPEIIELQPDAVVVNGPINETTKPHGEGYGFHEIGPDLQVAMKEAVVDIDTLVTASEDITALYDKSYTSIRKSVYLLSQWKASWDAAIAAAVTDADGIADAVASAAAVVAAGAVDGDQNSTNMIPLLLAAEAKGDKKEDGTVDVKKEDSGTEENGGNADNDLTEV